MNADDPVPVAIDEAIEQALYQQAPLMDVLQNPDKYSSDREVEDAVTYTPKTAGQLVETMTEIVERFGDSAELERGETGISGAHIHVVEYDNGDVEVNIN